MLLSHTHDYMLYIYTISMKACNHNESQWPLVSLLHCEFLQGKDSWYSQSILEYLEKSTQWRFTDRMSGWVFCVHCITKIISIVNMNRSLIWPLESKFGTLLSQWSFFNSYHILIYKVWSSRRSSIFQGFGKQLCRIEWSKHGFFSRKTFH